MIKVMQ